MSTTAATPQALHFGRFEILLAQRRLQHEGRPVALGSRAFDLLAALVTRRDQIVPKEELIERVWPGLVVEDNNLQVQISALRKVLGAAAIVTVPGRGYQFTAAALTPADPAAAPADPAPTGSSEAAQGRPVSEGAARVSRLLVADDNKVNRLLLCRSLALMGHEVASAENGRSALDRLRAERFDLLLLDLEMPEMDGFELLALRTAEPAWRDVPVIVTSSLEGAAQVARCIELGADDFLHKPVNPVLLKARVGASLERKHWRDRERLLLARLANHLPEGGVAQGAVRTEATVLVGRLRELDKIAALQPPPETLELLSSWTTLMLDAIEGQGGTLLQLQGDGIIAVFGAFGAAVTPAEASGAASRAADEMRELVALFSAERASAGKAPLALGIGIASGEVVAGRVGTPQRSALVCVGAAVQRAEELQALDGLKSGGLKKGGP